MNHPIIIAAFGTTARARETYTRADMHLRKRFPQHEIVWAYNSRMVRHKLKQEGVSLPSPTDALKEIAQKGGKWAVVQSFNMICGHEFERLKNTVLSGPVRVSIGHSLLCGVRDFALTADALAPLFAGNEAVVLVGHGTDHCSWSAYPALELILRNKYGNRAFVGLVEGEWAEDSVVIDQIIASGFKKVRLVPFMLVAGVHFEEDLTGPEDSWKSALEEKNISVTVETRGMGCRPEIIDIFAGHIQSALDVIPQSKNSLSQDTER